MDEISPAGGAAAVASFDPAVCEQEAIETPDAIQPHGAVLAVRADRPTIITHASANLDAFLGTAAAAALGRKLAALIGETASRLMIDGALQDSRPVCTLRRANGVDLVLQAHRTGLYVCIDIERPAVPQLHDLPLSLAQSIVQPLLRATTPLEVCTAAVDALAKIGGYDRVFAYRFDAAWNGEVIAECCATDCATRLEPYLGLHFPAVHVPERARRLYDRQRVITVPDTSYAAVPLLADPAGTAGPIDLTCSALRSISPQHAMYLRNMDAGASMSIGLTQGGGKAGRGAGLWGMLLCHHGTPRTAGPDLRAAAHMIGDIASLMLDQLRAGQLALHRDARGEILQRLTLRFRAYADPGEAITAAQTELLTPLGASGAVIWCACGAFSLGDAPPLPLAERIRAMLQPAVRTDPVAMDDIAARDAEVAAHAGCVSGALLAPLGADGQAILWVRPEHRRIIFWGGNPLTRAQGGLDPDVPTPTRDTVNGRCRPWTEADLVTAGTLATAVRDDMARRMSEMFRREVDKREAQDAALNAAVTALRERQGQLQNAEERLEQAQSIAGIGTWHFDVATGNLFWSKEMFRLRGIPPGQITPDYDTQTDATHPDDREARRLWFANLLTGQPVQPHEERVIRPDGEVRLVRLEGGASTDAEGDVRYIAGTFQDITERRQMEHRLAHAQKMESLGYLTGGMAHDFNNMLGVVMVNLQMLQRLVRDDASAEELCAEALEGANRCADLVRSLLAYARRQPLRPQRVDINALVSETVRLLRRTLGEAITMDLALDPALWPATVDAVQLESALVNLATNARDAMPRGGRLTITTRNSTLDTLAASLQPELEAGDYVVIEVTDTGTGIPPEVIGRIFDPFFTTKAAGTGTGLGLSMVFGFAKQSRGHLTVYSEVGVGTTFRLYVPRSAAARHPAAAPTDDDTALLADGGETVLVVEDNRQLRRAVSRQLALLGYAVVEAENAEGALAILSRGDRVDVLFSDIVMPGAIDGRALASRASLLRPGLAVLLTSGFSGLSQADTVPDSFAWRLLSKPYSREKLGHTLREVLQAARVAD
jgi:PAS domain S-box-containing protein